jgi:hypothetical protein
MAREFGPKGIHVAYMVIDAAIDLDWTRKIRPAAPDDFFIKPAEIADEIWHLAHQPKGAWSFNVELRPFKEVVALCVGPTRACNVKDKRASLARTEAVYDKRDG